MTSPKLRQGERLADLGVAICDPQLFSNTLPSIEAANHQGAGSALHVLQLCLITLWQGIEVAG